MWNVLKVWKASIYKKKNVNMLKMVSYLSFQIMVEIIPPNLSKFFSISVSGNFIFQQSHFTVLYQ